MLAIQITVFVMSIFGLLVFCAVAETATKISRVIPTRAVALLFASLAGFIWSLASMIISLFS